MLKFIFKILFLTPMFYKFWLIQSMILVLCFLVMISNYVSDFCLMGYYLGIDLISLGFIILSMWNGSLMIMASHKIYMNNNYKSGFIMMILFLMMFLFLSFSVMFF